MWYNCKALDACALPTPLPPPLQPPPRAAEKKWGCPTDLFTNQTVSESIEVRVHGHVVTRALSAGIEPTIQRVVVDALPYVYVLSQAQAVAVPMLRGTVLSSQNCFIS
jgi:hypothetical protein